MSASLLRGNLGQRLRDLGKVLPASLVDDEPQQAQRVRARSVAEKIIQEGSLALGREPRVGQRLTKLRLRLDGLSEAEKFILDLVELGLRVRHSEQCLRVSLNDAVLRFHWFGPTPPRHACRGTGADRCPRGRSPAAR